MDMIAERHHCPANLVLSVTDFLADQMVDRKEWRQALESAAFQTPCWRPESATRTQRERNEIFLSATIQLVQRNLDHFTALAHGLMHQTGLPLLVSFDECQMTSLKNTWGETLGALGAAGAISMTIGREPFLQPVAGSRIALD